MDNPVMRVKYWGVRGSIPSGLTAKDVRMKSELLIEGLFKAGVDKVLGPNGSLDNGKLAQYLDSLPFPFVGTYGSNTTCVEVQVKDAPLIVLDVGSGARALGAELAGRHFGKKGFNPLANGEHAKDIHILLTHLHWDHLQGFPFYGPAFFPGVKLHVYGRANSRKTLEDTLRGQQEFPNFPVEFLELSSKISCIDMQRMNPPPIEAGKAKVTAVELTHPDGVFAYRIRYQVGDIDKSFVFATDTEHHDVVDPRLVKLAKGADILYYDSQYLPSEYSSKMDWGHSTYEWAIKTALEADIPTVVLGHHEPARSDFDLYVLHRSAVQYRMNIAPSSGLEVVMGYEGLVQEL